MDPAVSFVLPTLDFSASFPIDNGSWSRTAPLPAPAQSPMSDLEFHNAWTSLERDLDSSSESFSDGSLSDSDSDGEEGWGDALTGSRRYSSGSVGSIGSIGSIGSHGSGGSEGWVGLGFSSRFAGRMQEHGETSDVEGPREDLF